MSLRTTRKLIEFGYLKPEIARLLKRRSSAGGKSTPAYSTSPRKSLPAIEPPDGGWKILAEPVLDIRYEGALHVKLPENFSQLKQLDKDFAILKSEIDFLCSNPERKIILEMPISSLSNDLLDLLREIKNKKYRLVFFFPCDHQQAKDLKKQGLRVCNNIFEAAAALKPATPTQ